MGNKYYNVAIKVDYRVVSPVIGFSATVAVIVMPNVPWLREPDDKAVLVAYATSDVDSLNEAGALIERIIKAFDESGAKAAKYVAHAAESGRMFSVEAWRVENLLNALSNIGMNVVAETMTLQQFAVASQAQRFALV